VYTLLPFPTGFSAFMPRKRNYIEFAVRLGAADGLKVAVDYACYYQDDGQ
jgi:hypothetical protein